MTPPNRKGLRSIVALSASGLLLAGFVLLAVHNLDYPGMWWDEATQFWVSQGISRYSPPFSQASGVRDVVRMNCLENLDPGGFSILLHVWTGFGRGLVWLRALPLVFFVVGAVALGLLGWRLTRSALFALGACAVSPLYPAALYFALEIRAYSMEMAGVAVGALALAHFRERPTRARAALLGVTCAAFLTSRYSFIFAALALGGTLAWVCARDARRRPAAPCLVAFLAPVGLIAAPVWCRHPPAPAVEGDAERSPGNRRPGLHANRRARARRECPRVDLAQPVLARGAADHGLPHRGCHRAQARLREADAPISGPGARTVARPVRDS